MHNKLRQRFNYNPKLHLQIPFKASNYLRVPVPLPHGVHDDALEVERGGVPGVVEDDARVGVVPQEDLQHLRQHLRPEVRERRVDLDQP